MTEPMRIDEADLHAFIDGALDAVRARRIETALAADPALAARVVAFQADKKMLQDIFAPIAERPVPAAWIALAQGRTAAPPAPVRSWRLPAAIAAALLLALLGVLDLWPANAPGEIVEAALTAREAPGRAEQVVGVAPGADAHRYDGVLRQAVAMKVKVPVLARMGYRLTGIHLYGGHAAELLYRDGGGRLFTLYVRRSDGAARFDQFEARGLRVCVWQDDELGMVMAGNVSTAAMQRLASLAYTGLTL